MSRIFTRDHEWLELNGDIATVGITHYAQEQLGDVVFVELPEVEQQVARGDTLVVIESVKAAGEIASPVSGEITAVNEQLADAPETVNQDPLNEGWMYRIHVSDATELEGFLSESEYQSLIGE